MKKNLEKKNAGKKLENPLVPETNGTNLSLQSKEDLFVLLLYQFCESALIALEGAGCLFICAIFSLILLPGQNKHVFIGIFACIFLSPILGWKTGAHRH